MARYKRKTVRELKASGTWEHLSKEEQAKRLAMEGVLTPGRPRIPADLDERTRANFLRICDKLAAEQHLAVTDAPLILEYIRVFADQDTARAE
jgi:hypothetical protein